MKRYLIPFFVAFLCCLPFISYSQDFEYTKVTELSELTTPATSDLFYIVSNPDTAPASRKMTIARLFGIDLTLSGNNTFTGTAIFKNTFTLQKSDGTPIIVFPDAAPTVGTQLLAVATSGNASFFETPEGCLVSGGSGGVTTCIGASGLWALIQPSVFSTTITTGQMICGTNTDGVITLESCGTTPEYTEPATNLPICRTGSNTIGACTNLTDVVAASASSTTTFTNKTMDVEATGNVVTIPEKVWLAAAGCNNTTASSFWDLPTTNAPAPTCATGTNTQKATLDFDASTDESAQIHLMLPSDFSASGNLDAVIKWYAAATSGNVVWAIQTSCVADAETDDPGWNTASTVIDTAKGTTLQINDASITNITKTGCAAGELMHIKLYRDADDGTNDTMTGDAKLIGVEITYRRAM